ncbi:MAG: hydrogenase expression/formation protein HypE [Deltaproteobacteria bacterium]|nr:hydrogenase expression/formation protein HypE [Deltaproteobacteria bacterium]
MRLLPGKLPVELLQRLLPLRGAPDRRVLLGPAFGQDAAVIDLGAQYLILKSDPVTFTADEVGWYAVHVNANDVAVMGARPAWFQASIIVPPGTSAPAVRRIFRDIDRAARSLGIAVTGGHTEISPAVRHPIVAGDMQGTVAREALVTAAGARAGDLIVMTKSAGLEGSAIIARAYPDAARTALGTSAHRRAMRFHHQPGISVVREALLAARAGATAMHDPTEGGVAAALFELATASRKGLVVDLDRIPVHPYTVRLCAHFGLRPLGLIGSGALLLTIAPDDAARLLRSLSRRSIPATIIGTVGRSRGVTARRAGKRVRFEWSQRDELTRLGG